MHHNKRYSSSGPTQKHEKALRISEQMQTRYRDLLKIKNTSWYLTFVIHNRKLPFFGLLQNSVGLLEFVEKICKKGKFLGCWVFSDPSVLAYCVFVIGNCSNIQD
jgi:hypothetical protein